MSDYVYSYGFSKLQGEITFNSLHAVFFTRFLAICRFFLIIFFKKYVHGLIPSLDQGQALHFVTC